MTRETENTPDSIRRSLLIGGGVAMAALGATHAMAEGSNQAHSPVAEPVRGPYPGAAYGQVGWPNHTGSRDRAR